MRRTFVTLLAAGLLIGVMAAPAGAHGVGNPNPHVIVYVTSQDLAYDSIVLTDIPFVEGVPYQLLEAGGPPGTDLTTEFGPGDPGYLGGRWWMDDGDGIMEGDDDSFFMCPLIGRGFEV